MAYCVTMSSGERLYLPDEECGILGYDRAAECARVRYVRERYPRDYAAWRRGDLRLSLPNPVTVEWVADDSVRHHDMLGGTAARIREHEGCASQAALSVYLKQKQRIAAAPSHTQHFGWRVTFVGGEVWEVVDPDNTMDADEAIDAAYHSMVRACYAIYYEAWKAGREELPIPEVADVRWAHDIMRKAEKPKAYSLETLTEMARNAQDHSDLDDIYFIESGPL